MIDVWVVGSHALWISGLALLLMTFSYRSWMGSQSLAPGVRKEMEEQSRPLYRLGFLLFILGMVATAGAWWERAAWAAVLLLLLIPDRSGKAAPAREGERVERGEEIGEAPERQRQVDGVASEGRK